MPDPTKPEPMLLTVAEAARRLGISRSSLYDQITSGAIRSVKIGKLRRVPVVALAEFVAALEGDER